MSGHDQEPNLTRRRRRTWVQPDLEERDGDGWYRPEFDSEREGAVAVGVDVIEIARIARVYEDFGERFLRKVFTERERDRYRGRANELAARFAAKEATSKALGTGIVGIRWKEMEVLSNRRGKPVLILHGQAAERARMLGLTDFSVSLTHSRTDAMAFVVAVSGLRTSAIQRGMLDTLASTNDLNTFDPDDDNDGTTDSTRHP
ncbi:MAG: holo-ACP synthase [Thermomicrobiales bacterium]